ncbi:MAG: SH3 domain-containing protein [Neptuniibacter sp.]
MTDSLIRFCFLIAVSFWSVISFADQDAYTIRDVPLKKSPALTSPDVTTLSKNSPVVIQQRQGGWYQVSSASQYGWLKLLSVRFADVMSSGASVKETSHYSSKTTLTTGIRGLSDGSPTARGKGADYEQLKQFQSNLNDAVVFAQEVGLRSREVSYVEE